MPDLFTSMLKASNEENNNNVVHASNMIALQNQRVKNRYKRLQTVLEKVSVRGFKDAKGALIPWSTEVARHINGFKFDETVALLDEVREMNLQEYQDNYVHNQRRLDKCTTVGAVALEKQLQNMQAEAEFNSLNEVIDLLAASGFVKGLKKQEKAEELSPQQKAAITRAKNRAAKKAALQTA